MNISVIGTGYVGLVTGVCFAQMGNSVICVDIDKDKIDMLNRGDIPIYEPSLDGLLKDNFAKESIKFSTNIKDAIEFCDICFIAVGTPTSDDGSSNLTYVYDVAKSIGLYINKHTFVVTKSTVPVGTTKEVKHIIQQTIDKRGTSVTFDVISNPEFLKEGDAVRDFLRPDRVIVGYEEKRALDKMRELYAPFISIDPKKLIPMDIQSSEMSKYASNAMLATKISFMNEMSNICTKVGANINSVREGIGSDSRIGYSFIYAGCGYGGSCFPKDIRALIHTAKDRDYDASLLQSVEDVNNRQKSILVDKILKRFKNVNGMSFGVWGLSFKPNTDDMRDASSIVIINKLLKLGANVKAYDPKAFDEAKKVFGSTISYERDKYEVLNGCDALILITEWQEFRSPDFANIKKLLKNPIIFDGRNQYLDVDMSLMGFEHYQIGVGDI